MYTHKTSDIAPFIMKPSDSPQMKEVKKVLLKMLSYDPAARPPIEEVVAQLFKLRTSLGVQVLTMALDTVWEPATLYSKFSFNFL